MSINSFLPMSIENDEIKVQQPYGSAISKDLPKQILSIKGDSVSISIKNVKEKEEFIEGVESSIKKMQRDMMNGFIYNGSSHYL